MSPSHWLIAPIVLPLLAGVLLTLIGAARPRLASACSLASAGLALAIALLLMGQADTGAIGVYLPGNWPAPFGIALALDRLSALMLVLTAIVVLGSLLYAQAGDAQRGRYFHALIQFQMMGLNGAFLTADLFNLFVFFEVLLIASYALLLHGGGRDRLRASVHYVGFNLAGSALFLIAVSALYGVTGTLNMADLSVRIAALSGTPMRLAHSAALLLLVVFCVKAALLPLSFWLPGAYSAASAPVASLFSIMTKVGVYAIVRVFSLLAGPTPGSLGALIADWLPWLGLITLGAAVLGLLSAQGLRVLVAYSVLASAGLLLWAVGGAGTASLGPALFYLVDSTLLTALMFLLVDRLAAVRGEAGDRLVAVGALALPTGLALLLLLGGAAAAGLPPFGGFLGKSLLMSSVLSPPLPGSPVLPAAVGAAGWPWAVSTAWLAILLGSLVMLLAYVRAGIIVGWESAGASAAGGHPPASAAAVAASPSARSFESPWQWLAIGLLGLCLLAVPLLAGRLSAYVQASAAQLREPGAYVKAVLSARAAPPAFDVRREYLERQRTGEKRP